MAAPVITPPSSILGFKRYEFIEFTPACTGDPLTWYSTGHPSTLTMDTPSEYSATGAASTDLVTATGHDFTAGTRVFFKAKSGGAGLSTNTIYYVRDVAGNDFKLAASPAGLALDFTTDISSATIQRVSSGRLSGYCANAGVHMVTLSATNGEGTGSRQFAIGISSEIAPSGLGSGTDAPVLQIVLPSCQVRVGADVSGTLLDSGYPAPILYLKSKDTRMLIIWFVDESGNRLDPNPATLKLTLKAYEPERAVVTANNFQKIGSGAEAQFFLPITLAGSRLASAQGDNEQDSGTTVNCLADVEWTRGVTHNSQPLTLQTSTRTFGVQVDRGIGVNA